MLLKNFQDKNRDFDYWNCMTRVYFCGMTRVPFKIQNWFWVKLLERFMKNACCWKFSSIVGLHATLTPAAVFVSFWGGKAEPLPYQACALLLSGCLHPFSAHQNMCNMPAEGRCGKLKVTRWYTGFDELILHQFNLTLKEACSTYFLFSPY